MERRKVPQLANTTDRIMKISNLRTEEASFVDRCGVSRKLSPPLSKRALIRGTSPWHLKSSADRVAESCGNSFAGRFMAVELQRELAEVSLIKTIFDNFQRRGLLGHEQHRLPVAEKFGDHVRDRLALAGTRGTVHDEGLSLLRSDDARPLSSVSIKN